ncbi:hypothetical protein GCM10023189_03030 [Nibrella saemangeumensis]|uniref:Addiction module component n=1 Tax=Nibrella saemangeumensis TaxID=1084526 RepID=A0ABP8MD61_9BACT
MMTTIQVQVSDEVIAHYGAMAIQEQLQKQLDWETLRIKAIKLEAVLSKAGLDGDELTREARKTAWEEYKHQISDKLPLEALHPES